jgi:disulfide bond formation protein DsbB
MSEMTTTPAAQRLLALGNYIYLLLMFLAIAGVLSAAMFMQYARGELPCPLCLLQRAALLGVCFGIMLDFRHGFSYQNTGFSLLFAIFLLIVAVRQTLLDIYPRPGHEYIGTAIFGLHMPVWSVVIALCLLIAYAVKLAAIGGNEHLRQYNIGTFPIIRLTQVVGLAAIDRAVFLKTTPLAEAPTFRRGRRHRQLLSVRQVLCRLRCCIVCRS